jgi:putative addiction module component (TIGR02574 family)
MVASAPYFARYIYIMINSCNNKSIDRTGGDKVATNTQKILKNALELPTLERANLVDKLLSSIDQPDEQIDNLWRKEVEDRIKAYQDGKIKAVTIQEVLSKYRK